MLNSSFSPWPSFTAEEADAVSRVISSNRVNYWTGEEGRAFEREFAKWAGVPHAIALANGTVALDLALRGLRIGSANGGLATDEVIVTPRTFIASVSCVVNAGAVPVFADVDAESGNISPATIKPVVTERAKAIIPVHLAGWPCDMVGILALAGNHGLAVVEDCAQAHGAAINGQSVGSFGDIGAWSFCQDKIMTTGGEGGLITTRNKALWSDMWSFKDHGKSWEAVYERQHAPGFRWVHESFGTNWRMLEMQAVIGRIQLQRLQDWVKRRREIAAKIREMLSAFSSALRCPEPPDSHFHSHYRQYAYVRPDGLSAGWDRDRIVAEATAFGLPLLHGSCSEVYLERAFDRPPRRPGTRLPVARELGDTSIMFLTHPTITDEQLDHFLAGMSNILASASR